jgi:hypothetical protein
MNSHIRYDVFMIKLGGKNEYEGFIFIFQIFANVKDFNLLKITDKHCYS